MIRTVKRPESNEEQFIEQKQKEGWYWYGSEDELIAFDDCKECSKNWDEMSPAHASLSNIGCDIEYCECDCHIHCKICSSKYEQEKSSTGLTFYCKTCDQKHEFSHN